MPFSSGTFSLYSTGNPVVTGTTISSSWANNTLSDIASGLSTCVLKDGTQTITANIPMSSFKLTGLAAGSANGNSLRYEQLFTSGTVTLLGALTTAGTVTVPTGNVAVTTGIVSVPDGTAAAPSIKVGDEQNGLYSGGVNTLDLAVGGVKALELTSTSIELFGVSGGGAVFLAHNVNNTASSYAEFRARVAGSSANDPFSSFVIDSGATWAIGADNSDSDAFVIAASATLGTSNALRINTTGAIQTGGTASAATGYSSSGDITLPATGAVRAKNTPKAWAAVTFSAGTPSIAASFNCTSVTDNGTGDTTVNLTNATADSNQAVSVTIEGNYPYCSEVSSKSTTAIRVLVSNTAAVLTDLNFSLIVLGN